MRNRRRGEKGKSRVSFLADQSAIVMSHSVRMRFFLSFVNAELEHGSPLHYSLHVYFFLLSVLLQNKNYGYRDNLLRSPHPSLLNFAHSPWQKVKATKLKKEKL